MKDDAAIEAAVGIRDAMEAILDVVMPLIEPDEQAHVWQTALVMLVSDLIVDCYEPKDLKDATKLFVAALVKSVPIVAKSRAEEERPEGSLQ